MTRRYPRVISENKSPSMTKTSFKDEVNINKIMAKFQKSGAIKHFAAHAPTYGDASQQDLHDAMNIVASAESMFEELPSSIRKRFENDPGQFLEFVQNPENLAEMRELGLTNKSHPLSDNEPDKPQKPSVSTPTTPTGSTDPKDVKPSTPEA